MQLSVPEHLRGITDINKSLAPFTTWDVGGTAEILVSPRNEGELVSAVQWFNSIGRSFIVLAGGSNVLVADGVIDTPVLYTGALKNIEISVSNEDVFVLCDAGIPLKTLFAMSINEGWSGLEFAAGIPGTIGGAVAGNAGTAHGSIAPAVEEIETVNADGSIKRWSSPDVRWSYRCCSLMQEGFYVISRIKLKLKLSDRSAVASKARLSAVSRKTQPSGVKTAGCVFKNTPFDSAGKLLDSSGCKGLYIGGARVSQKHANFIENYSGSSAYDITSLAMLCRDRVRNAFNISLQFEIKPLGFSADYFGDEVFL